MSTEIEQFDVVVIGGALSGAATALILKRERPELRVLVVEKSKTFGRRVGEATVEISTYFLTKILGLTTYLNESHLVKQGMRFWFFNDETRSLDECAEDRRTHAFAADFIPGGSRPPRSGGFRSRGCRRGDFVASGRRRQRGVELRAASRRLMFVLTVNCGRSRRAG